MEKSSIFAPKENTVKPLNKKTMKKVFVMAMAALAVTLASCGGNSKSAGDDVDSASVEATDSTAGEVAQAPVDAAASASAEIAQLTEQLESKDASKVQTTLEAVKAKIAELAKTDPEAAKTYVEQLQSWLKTNADKVKEATGNNAAVSTAVETLTTTSSSTLVEGYSKAKAAVESVTGAAGEAAGKATEAAGKAKDVVDKAKSITKEKVNEEANKAVDNAKEAAKTKAKEEAGKAVEKGLKSLGL